MKNLKNCIILSIFVSILLMPITFHLIDIQGSSKNSELEFDYLNSAGSWVLAPFAINPYGTRDYTWFEANETEWCSGAGTELDPWIIENVTIDSGGLSHCLEIGQSVDYFIIRNCTFNNAYPNYGIYSWSTSNGIIEDCTFFDNLYGVYISGNAENNTVQHNYFYNNTGANVRLFGATCINNTISNNILVNRLISNLPTAFSIQGYDNKLINNTADNFFFGVNLDYAHDTIIISNTFISGWRGISNGGNSFNATVVNNTIRDMSVYGISANGNGSIYYENTLINNDVNAQDYGHFNRWDNGVIGNYWDDYGGSDINDDGIGDSPYGVPGDAGTEDRFPIWDDGLEPIFINGAATGIGAHNWTWAESQPWCTGAGTSSNPYLIENISRDGRGDGFGISVENSDVYFEIRNCDLYNAGVTFPDSAILLNNVGNATVIGNNLTDTNFIGVRIDNSDNNYIIGNNASFTDLGILMTNSEFNHIINNTINDNIENAINIDDFSNNNTISGNTVNGNKYGISIYSDSNYNTIEENTLMDNNVGISLLDHCDNNRILNNELVDNTVGVSIHNFNSTNNVVYNNTFLLNTINGQDDSFDVNYWNYGVIGNYWDDYGGVDANDDGIGDSAYVVSGLRGRLDNYPIWSDGDDNSPTISINTPMGGSLFENDAPAYNLNIFDLNLNMSWYTLNDSATRYFFTPSNEINVVPIDETGWDSFSDGAMLMTFYVNDSSGNTASASNVITKDATNPTVTLNSPLGGTTFGSDAPEFNLTIYDLHLHDAWYTIGSSVTPHSFSPINGINVIQIDESSWDALPEGSITINFFVSDSVGNIHTIPVTINKDLSSSSPEPAIPFGNYYILFLGIGIVSILLVERKKRKK